MTNCGNGVSFAIDLMSEYVGGGGVTWEIAMLAMGNEEWRNFSETTIIALLSMHICGVTQKKKEKAKKTTENGLGIMWS